MDEFFHPSSIAVIGVSAKPTNLGRNILTNLIEFGYDGVLYAVGPNGGVILTHRIYRSVLDIPEPVDLAVIMTPARTVPGILEACGQKGIGHAIIETAGFREFDQQGRLLEEQLVEVAKQYGMRFIGPNCIGVISIKNGLCVPFPLMKRTVKDGHVSIISQSGGVGMSLLNLMGNEGIGLSKFASVGNMLDITADDMLEYLIDDPETRLIFLYLEGVRDGRRLMEIARRSPKPILALKANIGGLGQTIAASHTASLSSDDRVVDAAFRQAGIIRIHDDTSLVNNLKILELPAMRGKNLAILSRSGGHAVIAADACELSGFRLAHFPESFLKQIEQHFRASVIRLTNPLDLGDVFDVDVYASIIEQTLQLAGVDGITYLHTSISPIDHLKSRSLIERLIQLVTKYNKPVAYYLSADAAEVTYQKQHYNFPIFTQVVETIRALETSYQHCCQAGEINARERQPDYAVNRAAVQELVRKAKQGERDLLLPEALEALAHYGIATAAGVMAASSAEAQAAAERLGYPVAIKIVAEQVSHKSDLGGVQLNLCNGVAVAEAYTTMLSLLEQALPGARPRGVLVQPMVSGGVELIVGGRQDRQFGPLVLVGLGGIFTELLRDVVVRVAPITAREALEMIEQLRGAEILHGARGRPGADIAAVVETVMRAAQLLHDCPDIQELDINPLKVFAGNAGVCALDGRIILKKGTGENAPDVRGDAGKRSA